MIRQIRGQAIAHYQSGLRRADFVLTRWKGQVDGREGSFPANFVEVI